MSDTLSEIPSSTPGTRPGLVGGAAAVLGGSALLAVSAHVAIPFWPVPLTLQTLAVMLIGAVAGPRLGAATVLAYLLEGVAGLPVFAAGAGLAALAGPTGGYLLGAVPAVAFAGLAARRGRLGRPLGCALVFCMADALVFAAGLARLAGLVGGEKAVAVGLAPFLLGEGLKIALAVTLVGAARGSFKR